MDHNHKKAKQILIVEDEPALLKALEDKFTKEGFAVFIAKDGEKGLEIALQERPDMILLDLILPKMDGMTMLSKLHEDAWGKMAKVIVLTNLGDADSVKDCLSQGAFDYLVKTDWSLEDIAEKVKQRLHGV